MSNDARIDLSWMPQTAFEDWQRLTDDLISLRLQLAGLGLRHALDANRVPIDQSLAADIAAIQTALQPVVDRATEAAAALRDLAKLVEEQGAHAVTKEETIH